MAYILWLHLETAGFVGMLVLFLIMGIQTILGKFFGKLRLVTIIYNEFVAFLEVFRRKTM